jgi:hypothetical protein
MNSKFKLGDRVRKRDGDEYPGLVISVFIDRAGAVCYVVEVDPLFSGRHRIFNEEQLELRS